tara:strand:+ start:469 stop:606 length:138 start_codon:yes stop_codon:yes gene_type:complete
VLGMMVETYEDRSTPIAAWLLWLFSPIVLPFFIGTLMIDKSRGDE